MSAPAQRFVVRDARAADRPQLVRFMAALQELERALHASRAQGRRVADAHLGYLERIARKRAGRVLVAARGAEALGFLVCVVHGEEPGDRHLKSRERCYGLVTDLYVATGARARGVAGRLMAEAERHFSTLGLPRVRVATLDANQPAKRFYRALGYVPYEVTLERPLGTTSRRATRARARPARRARGRA